MRGPLKESTSCFLIRLIPLVLVPIGLFHRTQRPRLYLSWDSKSSPLSFTGLKVLAFIFHKTQSPRLYLSQDSKSKSSLLSFIGLKVLCLYAFIGPKVLCHLQLQDFNIFSLLHLQDFNVLCLLHFIRLQHLLSFIGLNVLVFVFLRTQHPLFLSLKKKHQMSFALQGFNVFHFTFYRTSMSFCLHVSLPWFSQVARLNSKITRMKLVSLSLLTFSFPIKDK